MLKKLLLGVLLTLMPLHGAFAWGAAPQKPSKPGTMEEADAAFRAKDIDTAILILRHLAYANDPAAQFKLAALLLQTPQQGGEDIEGWFWKAAEAGVPHSDNLARKLYLAHRDSAARFQTKTYFTLPEEAPEALGEFARSRFAQDAFGRGFVHYAGLHGTEPNLKNFPPDYVTAEAAFSWAARAGHAGAQFYLASILYQGLGRPADQAAGLEWMKKAALQGHWGARRSLGIQ